MAKDLFDSLDLNLLRTFLVISQELNLGRAAGRLFVSQSAVSQSLQKLRTHFSDPLFVRIRYGLKATPFAEQLAENITPHLDALSFALNKSSVFSAQKINRKIRIAISPQVIASIAGSLVRIFQEQAPHAELHIVNWNSATFSDIISGEIFIAISYEMDTSAKEIFSEKIADLTPCIIVRNEHPIKKQRIVPSELVDYDIASIIVPGWNDKESLAQKMMAQLGLSAKVGFRSELPLALINVVQNTDMYMPITTIFPVEQHASLRRIDVDLPTKMNVPQLFVYSHLKNKNSKELCWLIEIVKKLIQDINHT